ncbi:hypothetical protein CRUP_035557, partial [Coryphaenoides rupestris]
PQHSAPSDHVLDGSARTSSPDWPVNSTFGGEDGEFGEASRQQGEEPVDLAKELLGQQCEELRGELDLKEREVDVLRDEVSKSAEDLDEARSRWAQVTEELKEALSELEEEREKRRTQGEELDNERERRKHAEEETNTKTPDRDNLENSVSPSSEAKEDMDGREDEKEESPLLLTMTHPSTPVTDKLPADPKE